MLNWLSYPRAVLAVPLVAAITLTLSLVAVVTAVITRSSRAIDFVINELWAKSVLWLVGVAVEVRGQEHVPQGGKGFLLLFNHTSLLDIPVLFGNFPRSFRFGAKIELFRVPLFGAAMRACGILPIDRNNRSQVMQVYEQAITRVDAGECFALAPEGTRQDAQTLGRFKRGPFEFALNAQMNVLPVVIAGVPRILPKQSLLANAGRWRRTVLVEITPPISSTQFHRPGPGEDSRPVLDVFQAVVRDQMGPVLERLNAEVVALD